MRLVRGFQTNGTCKYALVRLDKMRKDGVFKSIQHFLDKYPELQKYVEFGQPGSKEEFFVFKFKDLASTAVLKKASEEYSRLGDEEFSNEILGLLDRTGENHPNCKQADTDPSSYILEDINNPISIQTHTDICTNFGFSVDNGIEDEGYPLVKTPSDMSACSSLEVLDKVLKEACGNIVINEAIADILKERYKQLSLEKSSTPTELLVKSDYIEMKRIQQEEDNWNCL